MQAKINAITITSADAQHRRVSMRVDAAAALRQLHATAQKASREEKATKWLLIWARGLLADSCRILRGIINGTCAIHTSVASP